MVHLLKKVFFNKFLTKKKKLNIGYFGSCYKSRGVDLILKLSKIDRENRYFIFGNLKNYKNIRIKNYNHNLNLNDYLPYKAIPENISKNGCFIDAVSKQNNRCRKCWKYN